MQQPQGRSLTRLLPLLLLGLGCSSGPSSEPVEAPGGGSAGKVPEPDVSLPRDWTQVDRATPKLSGRFGPHDWTRCKGAYPCEALTWSPVDPVEPRPTLTILITAQKVWQTQPESTRWRKRWNWVDPLLAACLGDGLSIHLDSLRINRTLVEHSDGFWWAFDMDGAGPCDLNGGIELQAAGDKGRATRLTAGGHRWGSPAAVGFATDVLTQVYDPPSQP